jgi:hypothetical protein
MQQRKGEDLGVRFWCALGVIVAALLGSVQHAVAEDIYIGIGAQAFFDDVDLTGERKVAVLTTDESYAASSDGLLSGSLWFLAPVWKRFYAGGQVQYFGTYTTLPEDEREDDDRVKKFGSLLELTGRGEWLIDIDSSLSVGVGGQVGLVMLFPSDDLEAEIKELEEQGASVAGAGTPRLGYLVGPVVSTRWKFHERVALRGELSMKWEQIFIFKNDEKIGGVPFRKDWQLDLLRYEVGLGLEFVL